MKKYVFDKQDGILLNKLLNNIMRRMDSITREHSERVSVYAILIGKTMQLTKEDLKLLGVAGLLHDVGKMLIAETILYKNIKLNQNDWRIMKQHSALGIKYVESQTEYKQMSENGRELFRRFISYTIGNHHRFYDGTGYGTDPFNSHEKIPLFARIMNIADSFDAMTSYRPYNDIVLKPKKTNKQAIKELNRCAGTQFDPFIVHKFSQHIEA